MLFVSCFASYDTEIRPAWKMSRAARFFIRHTHLAIFRLSEIRSARQSVHYHSSHRVRCTKLKEKSTLLFLLYYCSVLSVACGSLPVWLSSRGACVTACRFRGFSVSTSGGSIISFQISASLGQAGVLIPIRYSRSPTACTHLATLGSMPVQRMPRQSHSTGSN